MPENNPRGIDAALTDVDKRIAAIFLATEDGSIKASESLRQLEGVLTSVGTKAAGLKATEEKILATLKKAELGNISYGDSLRKATAVAADSSKIMLGSEKDLYETRIKLIKEAERLTRDAGDTQGTIVWLEKRRTIEREYMQDTLRSEVAVAKARGGINGAFTGMLSNVRLKGSQAADTIGGFFGLSGPAMSKLATGLGGAAILITALNTVFTRLSTNALRAAESGLVLNDSYGAAARTGGNLAMQIRLQSGFIMQESEVYGLLEDARNNYVMGLIGTGKAYYDLSKGSIDAQNAARMSAVGFVVDMSRLSAIFGMTKQEAVSLATKIGVMTKGGMPAAELAFFNVATEARNLGIPMAKLVDVMGSMAAQSDYMGQATGKTVAQLTAITETIFALGAVGGKGLKGFANIDAEKIERITRQIVDTLGNLSSTRLMALNMRPGENFNTSLSKLEQGGMDYRIQAAKSAMQKMGVDRKNSPSELQLLGIGKILGVQDEQKAIQQARQMYEIFRTGNLDSKQVQRRMEEMTNKDENDRLARSMKAGGQLMAGMDPLARLVILMTDILKILVDVTTGDWKPWKSEVGKNIGAEIRRNEAAGRFAESVSRYTSRRATVR